MALVSTAHARPMRERGPDPVTRPVVRVLTALAGGGFRLLTIDLVDAYRKFLPGVTFETHPGVGSAESVEAVNLGRADLSFAFADQAYAAFVGTPGKQPPMDQLRVIAVTGATPVQFVVRRGAGIASIEGIRGKRVGVGVAGGPTELTVDLLLTAFGIRRAEVGLENLSLVDAGRRLGEGTLDALFTDTIYPSETITAATQQGAGLVPLKGQPIERLRREYPFFRLTLIPRDSYPQIGYDVVTLGVDSLLICRRNLDERLVYDLTRGLFEALPRLSAAGRSLRLMDVDRAAAAPIPLHDGAARYYREQELRR